MAKRRRFTAASKARVGLEALRGDKTVQELAAKHQVHPNQVSTWKRKASDGLLGVFAGEALERVKYNSRSRPGLFRLRSFTPAAFRSRMARQRNLTLDTLATLWNTVSVMQRLPFRKSLVLVSDGFSIVYGNPGAGLEIDSAMQKATRRLTDACHRAGVVIYSIDARGVQTPPQFHAEISASAFRRSADGIGFYRSSGLHMLARETGGVYFRNYNFADQATRRMLSDQQGYYRVAYTPDQSSPQAGDGRFDKIKVKANKRGLKVRSRSAAFSK